MTQVRSFRRQRLTFMPLKTRCFLATHGTNRPVVCPTPQPGHYIKPQEVAAVQLKSSRLLQSTPTTPHTTPGCIGRHWCPLRMQQSTPQTALSFKQNTCASTEQGVRRPTTKAAQYATQPTPKGMPHRIPPTHPSQASMQDKGTAQHTCCTNSTLQPHQHAMILLAPQHCKASQPYCPTPSSQPTRHLPGAPSHNNIGLPAQPYRQYMMAG